MNKTIAFMSIAINWDYLFAVDWKVQGLNKTAILRVDGVFDPDSTTLKYEIFNTPEFSSKLMVLEIPETDSANYSLFSKNDNGKFLKLYNAAHTKVLASQGDVYGKLLAEKIGSK